MKAKTIISIAVVAVILAGIASVVVYSGEWPPMYVVESESMEHSHNWTAGTINTGDLVMSKNINANETNVITYVQGRAINYSTYGEYGNVILYHNGEGQIIIHRAMFYLEWNGSHPTIADYHNQSWIHITDNAVILDNVGYTHRNLIVYVGTMVGESGFITVGDYNLAHSPIYNKTYNAYSAADQDVFGFSPVKPDKVVGKAFGQIPWVGLIKLNIMRAGGGWPQYNEVPNNAYTYLVITVIAIIALAAFPYGRVLGKKKK